MTIPQITQIESLLSQPQHIVIIPHRNPDGDAMGSTLALAGYLKKKGHTPQVIAPNEYPQFLQWLPGNEEVLIYSQNSDQATEKIMAADLVFTLDFNHFSRTGSDMEAVLKNVVAPIVMIDHHQQPADYAVVTYSDTAMSSTCEMIYHFIDSLGDTELIDKDMASCIYTGIMTDTGSFRFSSTTAQTHQVVAALIAKGANNTEIHQNLNDSWSLSKMQLLGVALKNLRVLEEFNTAYITITQKELDDHNFQKGDTEGFVNYGLTLLGIRFAVIFIENKADNIIKMSLRSKGDFSVNDVAREHYSGGGHINAAGGKSDLNMEDTITHFISILPQYKAQLTQ
ncbi:bifunctional oligoribonuclease/PAP phosphatase NrnA [Dokdonia sinensis]|uniref:Bifunctional oligoribonuclease/PAP phosphatase NrnA n=1 Tax=Dokdonia sinensis TaxID=2479847 RepID=A0A3M0GFT1_9FLAO|nr:bifunctional oligoribonuclease/PAP phosphatase NrnA [Dokdonia sinensis]RMB60463.1 bifunctional oligoribonuclease/PAP phosphatase NrnA [Dokdonia sinensis]